MTHESTVVLPVAVELDKAVFAPAHQAPGLLLPGSPPDSEQVRALEAVFAANKEKESTAVNSLLGLWTGTLILHDLAVEAFSEPAGEVEPEKKPKDKDEPEAP
jgi:hypothetical protein